MLNIHSSVEDELFSGFHDKARSLWLFYMLNCCSCDHTHPSEARVCLGTVYGLASSSVGRRHKRHNWQHCGTSEVATHTTQCYQNNKSLLPCWLLCTCRGCMHSLQKLRVQLRPVVDHNDAVACTKTEDVLACYRHAALQQLACLLQLYITTLQED